MIIEKVTDINCTVFLPEAILWLKFSKAPAGSLSENFSCYNDVDDDDDDDYDDYDDDDDDDDGDKSLLTPLAVENWKKKDKN